MQIDEVIEMLKKQKQEHGNIAVSMIGTFCPEGYSMSETKVISDVFETSVESSYVREDDQKGKRLMIQWQC